MRKWIMNRFWKPCAVRGWLAGCIALSLALAAAPAPAAQAAEAAAPSFSLEAPIQPATAGGTVVVRLRGAGLQRLFALEATVTYDDEWLRLDAVRGTVEGFAGTAPGGGDGTAKAFLTMLGNDEVSGDAALLELRFTALDVRSGTIALTTIRTEDADGNRAVVEADATVRVNVRAAGNGPDSPPANDEAGEPPGLAKNRPPSDASGAAVYELDAAAFEAAVASSRDTTDGERKIVVDMDASTEGASALLVDGGALARAAASAPEATLSLRLGDDLSYELPLALFAGTEDGEVEIRIEPSMPPSVDGVRFLAPPYAFRITVASEDGVRTIRDFGDRFAVRAFRLPSGVDGSSAAGATIDEATGRPTFVPTALRETEDGTVAELRRNGNSVYAIVRIEREPFADLDGHWAQRDIEALASKLLVSGRTDDRFAPDESIRRSEWAALLVRGLGLVPVDNALSYEDTREDAWYAESVAAAQAAGLIEGFPDGRFLPDEPVTREQMAATLVRARSLIGAMESHDAAAYADLLSAYADATSIGGWAKPSVAAAVQAGWLQGMGDGTMSPRQPTTRAQAALALHRMLTSSGWMN
ncbi:S-layer homology domain-containing protein [Paenibacillus antri]|nr:S-layer homology domain-containing protein [Paenibacillus antri]